MESQPRNKTDKKKGGGNQLKMKYLKYKVHCICLMAD